MSRDVRLFLTCEHAGNEVPSEFAHLFTEAQAELDDHWGWDPGALGLAKALATRFDCPLVFGTVTRLLVELNRSIHGHDLFSRHVRHLPWETRLQILDRHYWPYRRQVASQLGEWLREGATIWHVSVHSFTPIWHGEKRQADIGLLFDPAHRLESSITELWEKQLQRAAPQAIIRRNYPYQGIDDSFPTYLRRQLPVDRYAGFEIEMNQGLRDSEGHFPTIIASYVGDSISAVLEILRRGND